MGNLDEDEQKNLRKQTCSNLGDVFPRERRAKDGSMKAFGVFCSIKKGRREGGWEEPRVQRRLLMPVSHLLMIFRILVRVLAVSFGWSFSARSSLGTYRHCQGCSSPEGPDLTNSLLSL